MTQRRTLIVRHRDLGQDFVCQLFTSYTNRPGAPYVASIHWDGAITHRSGASAYDAEVEARAVIEARADILSESRYIERSRIRAVRVRGVIRVVHGQDSVPLDEDSARAYVVMPNYEVLEHLERRYLDAPPSDPIASVWQQWLADSTVDWGQFVPDLCRLCPNIGDADDPPTPSEHGKSLPFAPSYSAE